MDAATQSADGASHPVLGRTIAGKFVIESYLGGGAMGAVYKARQTSLDKLVAIKVLHGEHAGDSMFAARFQREARAASKLDHPNSMRVLDFGQEPDGLLYIAMEFLDGRDLFHVIREDWPITPVRAADVLSQALAAIAVAHDMGIVHRDLKPENIMLMSGTDDEGTLHDIVKVCDFGIAKFTDAQEPRSSSGQKLTTQGIVVGTPEYMSPEQSKGEVLDSRSDLYSVGCILYQLLTGRVPFDAETALGIVLKHVTEEPIAPRQLNPLADPRLETICLKAMRKKREERYQHAREMRADLRVVVGATDPLAHAVTAELQALGAAADASAALAMDAARRSAATMSKLTPVGTASDSAPAVRGQAAPEAVRGRALFWALGLTAVVAGGGVAVWKEYPRGALLASTAPTAPSGSTAAPPPTTLEPLRAPNADLPPLEPTLIPSGKSATPAPPAPVGKTASAATARGGVPVTPPALAPVAAPSTSPAIAELPATSSAAAPAPLPPPLPAAAPPLPAAAASPFDASRAHVDWSVASSGGGATAGAVQRALSRSVSGWTQCYRAALVQRGERVEGTAVLHLTTDESGNVVGAQVRGFDAMPGVKSCVAGGARVHIDGVDTGDAWADVQLAFRAE